MSADNGVYITKWTDGFRVTEAQAIGNIDYFVKGSKDWDDMQVAYFGRSKVYPTLEGALKKAYELEDEILSDEFCPILEYGVCVIPGNRGDFPKQG